METNTVRLSDEGYLGGRRALAAWWSLGSSAVDPALLLRYIPARLPASHEAGV